jgi:hypothetical protein
MVGNMIRVLRARMTLLAVDEVRGCRRWSIRLSQITPLLPANDHVGDVSRPRVHPSV